MYVHLQTELRGAPKYNIIFMILCRFGVWRPLAALDGCSLVQDKSTSLRLESRTVCVNSLCFSRIIYIWCFAYDLDTLLAFGRYHLQWFWARNQLSLHRWHMVARSHHAADLAV
jgi:hypothetical protein